MPIDIKIVEEFLNNDEQWDNGYALSRHEKLRLKQPILELSAEYNSGVRDTDKLFNKYKREVIKILLGILLQYSTPESSEEFIKCFIGNTYLSSEFRVYRAMFNKTHWKENFELLEKLKIYCEKETRLEHTLFDEKRLDFLMKKGVCFNTLKPYVDAIRKRDEEIERLADYIDNLPIMRA